MREPQMAIDVLRAQAHAYRASVGDYELTATSPQATFAPNTNDLSNRVGVNFESVQELLDIQGVDPSKVRAMAVHFKQANPADYQAAEISPKPISVNERAHYPVVNMPVDPEHIDLEGWNRLLRHELRHLAQPYETPLYSTRFGRIAVAVGGITMYRFLHRHDSLERDAIAFAEQHTKINPIFRRND